MKANNHLKSAIVIEPDRVSANLHHLVGMKWGDLVSSGEKYIGGTKFMCNGNRWLERNNFVSKLVFEQSTNSMVGPMIFPSLFQGSQKYRAFMKTLCEKIASHFKGDLTDFPNSKGLGCLFTDWVNCSSFSLLPIQNAKKFTEDKGLLGLSSTHKIMSEFLIAHLAKLQQSRSIHISKLSSTGAPLFLFGEDKALYARIALSHSRQICESVTEDNLKSMLALGILPFYSSGVRKQSDAVNVSFTSDFLVSETEMAKQREYPDLSYVLSHGAKGSFQRVDYRTDNPLFFGARVRFVWALSYGINIQLAGPAKAITSAFSNSPLLKWKGHDELQRLRKFLRQERKLRNVSGSGDRVAIDFSNFEATQNPYLTEQLVRGMMFYLTDDYVNFVLKTYGLGCIVNSVSAEDNMPAIVGEGTESLNVALKSGTWLVSPNGRFQGAVQSLVTHSIICYTLYHEPAFIERSSKKHFMFDEDADFQNWLKEVYLPSINETSLKLNRSALPGAIAYRDVYCLSFSDDTFIEDLSGQGKVREICEKVFKEIPSSQAFLSNVEELDQFLGGIITNDDLSLLSATSFLDNRCHSERGFDSKPEGSLGFLSICNEFRQRGGSLSDIPDLLLRCLDDFGISRAHILDFKPRNKAFDELRSSNDSMLIDVVNDPSKLNYKYDIETFATKWPEIFEVYYSSIHYSEWQEGLSWALREGCDFPISNDYAFNAELFLRSQITRA